MKISALVLFLKAIIIAIIIFSILGLSSQFIFSYFNQDVNGRELTVFNFAAPLLLTIFILLHLILKPSFNEASKSKSSFHAVITIAFTILLLALIIWQMWYVMAIYKMKAGFDFKDKFLELLPMTVGLIATSFFITRTLRRKQSK